LCIFLYHITVVSEWKPGGRVPASRSINRMARKLVEEFQARPTLRAGSLITTVFGDAIAPRGGSVWLGSLIGAMAEFGINERLVRTSVHRLAGDGWLEARPVGRRSYYELTQEGAGEFERATRRIYGEPRSAWDGSWTMVLLAGVDTPMRDELRKALGWQGFGAIGANLMLHPSADDAALDDLFGKRGVGDQIVVMRGSTGGAGEDHRLRELAQKSWELDEIDARYEEFLSRFRPVYRAADKSGAVEPQHAFQVRTLLIQEYRKILLRDPLLPGSLLPADWQGLKAYQLCRNLYRLVYAPADRFLSEHMETAEGPLPPPGPAFYKRFGGLEREAA